MHHITVNVPQPEYGGTFLIRLSDYTISAAISTVNFDIYAQDHGQGQFVNLSNNFMNLSIEEMAVRKC